MSDERRMCPILAMSRGTDQAICQRTRCQWWVTMDGDKGGCSVQIAAVWMTDLLTAGSRMADADDPKPATAA